MTFPEQVLSLDPENGANYEWKEKGFLQGEKMGFVPRRQDTKQSKAIDARHRSSALSPLEDSSSASG